MNLIETTPSPEGMAQLSHFDQTFQWSPDIRDSFTELRVRIENKLEDSSARLYHYSELENYTQSEEDHYVVVGAWRAAEDLANLAKRQIPDGSVISFLRQIDQKPLKDICFIGSDNTQVCVKAKLSGEMSGYTSRRYADQHQEESNGDSGSLFEDFDFPVVVKPRRSYKIGIQIELVRKNEIRPSLDFD